MALITLHDKLKAFAKKKALATATTTATTAATATEKKRCRIIP